MEDAHDDLLSEAVNRSQREEIDLDDGLDHILSQSLHMFEEKKILDDAIDSTDMFESGGHSLVIIEEIFTRKRYKNPFVMPCVLQRFSFPPYYFRCVTGHRSEALQSYKRETDEQQVRLSKIVQGQSGNNTSCVDNFGGMQIPKLAP